MAWEGSTRKQRLPNNWQALRLSVLDRDGWRCTVVLRDGTRCRDRATEVDHIINNDDDSPSNLAAMCGWHHRRKSSIEGNRARIRNNNRQPEQHPGLR